MLCAVKLLRVGIGTVPSSIYINVPNSLFKNQKVSAEWLKCQICFLSTAGKRLVLSSHNGGISSRAYSDSDATKYKVVFIGSDTFSVPTLVELVKFLGPENVSVVVSSDKNVVSKFAKKYKNKIYLWNDFKSGEFDAKVRSEEEAFHFDFGVVASFGYLIPARVINRFPLGILNVHASLLPRWRGATPINHSIMFGDTETGISIMKIAPHRFDVGPVLLKKAIPLSDDIRAPELHQTLASLGATALLEVIRNLSNFLSHPLPQDDSLATTAPKLTPEMAEVDWCSKTAVEVYRLFRGLFGTFKLRTTFNERRIDLDELELPIITITSSNYSNNVNFSSNNSDIASNDDKLAHSPPEINSSELPPDRVSPGEIVFTKKGNLMCVRCAQSSGVSTWVVVKKVKVGSKWMSAKDFRNGFLSKGKLSSGLVPRFYLSKSVIEDQHCLRNM